MTVICLGEPPVAVHEALVGAGIDVTVRDVMDIPEPCSMLIVHAPDGTLDPEAGPWLDQATDDGSALVFSVPRVTPAFVRDVFLPHGLALVVRTEPLDRNDVDQLVALARPADGAAGEPAADDFPIGSLFGQTESVDQYESARALSLLGRSMSSFMADLSDITRRLITHLPPRPVPWDPDDLSPPALVRKSGDGVGLQRNVLPNLADVFAAYESPAARELLRNRPGDRDGDAGHPPAVLILGETGTGKSLVAETFREQVSRAMARRAGTDDVRVPFVQVNCGGMTADNFDHILFGAAPGHFTGVSATVGLLARAAYGVVFFDEIGDLTLGAQQRLLTFLDHRRITPTGIAPFPAHVHVIAATNRDLSTLVAQGRFRHDLLSRFSAQLTIPPLRDRDADELRRLVDFVASNPAANAGGQVTHVRAAAMNKLLAMPFREGNFRELESIVHAGLRAAARRRSRFVEAGDVDSWEESFVPDELERVVRIGEPIPVRETDTVIASLREIHRLAHLLGRPLLRGPDGDLVVRDGEEVYRRRARPR